MAHDDTSASGPDRVPLVFVRVGGEIRAAPPADQAVARSYPIWPDKGPVAGTRRLTILTGQLRVRPGQEVRVIHVAEALSPEAVLYIMGPKAVLGEYVDGELATMPGPDPDRDPLRPPGLYDGPVVPGPAVDHRYEVSVYRFESAGEHRISWRLGPLVSNELVISVE